MPITRVYADTSVFGGVFDEEFQTASRAFFDEVESGRFHLVTSVIVEEEITPAPVEVKEFFDAILESSEVVDITEDVVQLQAAYLGAKIVSPKWSEDALHVAIATVSNCSLLVSWNFRHIVHFEKIPLYNAVNTLRGYGRIDIFSPLEVVHYEDQNV
ncbi:MAG: type II toxin-antitoxin system VapC family toxin [Chloroflexi bacterium]|nr:type II toxin-antitoxin system VapC family toxin [Chloroflexota bacterium]